MQGKRSRLDPEVYGRQAEIDASSTFGSSTPAAYGRKLKGTTDAAPAQDTSGPGGATASAFPAPQVPVVDAATNEATTQEDEPEASGSESDDGSDDNETLDKLMGVVDNVMKQLDSMKKKKKKKGKKSKKKGDKKRRK